MTLIRLTSEERVEVRNRELAIKIDNILRYVYGPPMIHGGELDTFISLAREQIINSFIEDIEETDQEFPEWIDYKIANWKEII